MSSSPFLKLPTLKRVACTAYWTVIAAVVMFRVYSLLILPMLLKLGVPSDLAWWTEPFVIEELQESATLFVFLAAIGIFPWNDKLSFWGFVLMVVLWLAVPYRWPL